MKSPTQRRGFALAVALAAIVIIGGLIAGVFFASTQEYRIGRNTILQTRALATAEYGLTYILTGFATNQWSKAWDASTNPGVVGMQVYTPSPGTIDTVRVTSLGNGNFMITSEGRVGALMGAQARKRIGMLVALNVPQINVMAALTTRGAIKIGGSSNINGNDNSVAGWNCPPTGSALPGITTSDTTKISYSGCNNQSCLSGSPKVAQDTAAGDTATYTQFGSVNWSQLAAMADKTYPAGATLTGMAPSFTGTACNTSDPNNWGDPLRTGSDTSCASYYPIIYVPGSLHLTGGVGQGILMVAGDLQVSGGFQFYGPVLVQGSLNTTGTGGHFNGGVMAANVDFEQNTVLGNAVVNYSSCALAKAVKGSARVSLANGRSWVDLP